MRMDVTNFVSTQLVFHTLVLSFIPLYFYNIGVGISMGILNIVFMGYASMVRYWLIEYMVTSFTGLPWLSCNNTWNTNSCITSDTMVQINDSRFDGNITYHQSMNIEDRNTLVSSEEEFRQ